MMEMQAVLGRIQLERMADWTAKRTKNAAVLREMCLPYASSEGFLSVPDAQFHEVLGQDSVHAYYKYYVYVRPENLPADWSRDKIIQAFNEQGIPCFSGSCSEIYLEHAFDNHPSKPQQRLPVAKQLGETSLMFLAHPTLTDAEMQKVAQVGKTIFDQISQAVTSA